MPNGTGSIVGAAWFMAPFDVSSCRGKMADETWEIRMNGDGMNGNFLSTSVSGVLVVRAIVWNACY